MSPASMEFSTDNQSVMDFARNGDEVARLSCVTNSFDISCGFNISVVMTRRGDKPVYHLRCGTYRLGEEDEFWTQPVDAGRINYLIEQLAKSHVPAIPEAISVCDGTVYELTINRGSNGVAYRWADLPPGYETIGNFANRLKKLAGITSTG